MQSFVSPSRRRRVYHQFRRNCISSRRRRCISSTTESLHIITPKACISSRRRRAYHHAEGVHIINDEGVAYHQPVGLHIIKPQEDTRWRVMRYKGGKPPLMIYTTLRAVMICQACGLDKKIRCQSIGFFGGGWWIRTTEVSDNRFTVCPLWPLGKSPRYGAGERSRTINRLITNQVLCH